MARLMGTTEAQPLTTQANVICKHIQTICPESTKEMAAGIALKEERELEYVQNLAFQITDHPKAPDYVLFNEALDGWILDVDSQANCYAQADQ